MDFTVSYDVAVVGGGVAGIAAAIQSARSGKKTVLIEKTILLGGLATSGLVYIYLPLCDGNGHQATHGICEELLRNSIQYGPGEIPENWRQEKNAPERKRLMCRFSPASFMLSLEELLRNSQIVDMISKRIDALQEGLASFEKIKKFTLLPREFTMENGELTNTLKIRRPVINRHYAKLIEAMYA